MIKFCFVVNFLFFFIVFFVSLLSNVVFVFFDCGFLKWSCEFDISGFCDLFLFLSELFFVFFCLELLVVDMLDMVDILEMVLFKIFFLCFLVWGCCLLFFMEDNWLVVSLVFFDLVVMIVLVVFLRRVDVSFFDRVICFCFVCIVCNFFVLFLCVFILGIEWRGEVVFVDCLILLLVVLELVILECVWLRGL